MTSVGENHDWHLMEDPSIAEPLDDSPGTKQTRVKLFNNEVLTIAVKIFGSPGYSLAKLAFWHWQEVIIDGKKCLINVSSAQKRLARVGISAKKIREYLKPGFTEFVDTVKKEIRRVNPIDAISINELVKQKVEQTVAKRININLSPLINESYELQQVSEGVPDRSQVVDIKPMFDRGGEHVVHRVDIQENNIVKTHVLAIPLFSYLTPVRLRPKAMIPIFIGLVRERLCKIGLVGKSGTAVGNGTLTCRLMTDYTRGDLNRQKEQTRNFNLRDILRISYRLVNAMRFLHSQNIVHNDLKPLNVFVTNDWECDIGDFDWACQAGAEDRSCGTPYYMPPEKLLATLMHDDGGQPNGGWGAVGGMPGDCWAMGCLLYAVFIGDLPWATSQTAMDFRMRRPGDLPQPQDPLKRQFFQGVILPLLTIDREQRYSANQALSAIKGIYLHHGYDGAITDAPQPTTQQ